VYNGEQNIRAKLGNTLELDYPREKMEIVVVSDGSTDRTNKIVREYASQNVKLVALDQRRGKESAQKIGIDHSNGEIIIFSDAGTIIRKDAIQNLLSNFNDEGIGCVSGEDIMSLSEECYSLAGEMSYGNYELSIRRLESLVGTMIGVSGCFFAVRKELTGCWPEDVPSDFMVPLLIIKKGKRVVSEPKAICFVGAVKSLSEEFERKVRTMIRGMTTLFRRKEMLNLFRWGIVSVELASHKLFRWLVPLFLILLFTANYYLIRQHLFYKVFMILQSGFYLLSIVAFLFGMTRVNNRLVRILSFYLMTNVATMVAWGRYISGDKRTIWEPSKR
jgi:cellulose synthase/poly-beta-1,6-N-acetylglucosamine synthase-like glycosyltransferase